MGVTKTEIFTEEQNQMADLAKALAHPARVAILEVLAKRKSCICNEIVDELPLSQATVSQHLKELKRIGIIKGEIDPPRVCYCINGDVAHKMMQYFGSFIGDLVNCKC
jgi:ArsR family transcriptional regulator, arsenate/arsenite/antimonite-responsive transcriptional repressor